MNGDLRVMAAAMNGDLHALGGLDAEQFEAGGQRAREIGGWAIDTIRRLARTAAGTSSRRIGQFS